MLKILVTGAAGFIGFHVSKQLSKETALVTGVDNLNSYYSVDLKRQRLKQLEKYDNFDFFPVDIADRTALNDFENSHSFDACIHLAAQAGVRYSLDNPAAYVDSNLLGFANLLEVARRAQWQHFVFASSSSVYGGNTVVPFSEDDQVDHPLNLYAATKKANELMAHSYSHLFRLPATGLRFFTVYGPWGRPDMAIWKFTEAIDSGRPIDVYNEGQMERDFTYIDDIVAGVINVLQRPPDVNAADAPYRIYNIGNNQPERLEDLIAIIESAVGKCAKKNILPLQAGDMLRTYANIDRIRSDCGFVPRTSLKIGVEHFVKWYLRWKQG